MTRRQIEPGPLAEVSLESTSDRWTLVFVREIPHPPEKVWRALTDPAHVGEWAPYTVDRNLGSLGAATLTMIDGEGEEPTSASVLRADEPTLLEYTWGDDLLRWVLTPTEAGTRLTLRHTLADRDWAPRVAAGWHLCLVVAQRLLDGDPVGPIRGNEAREHGWDELHQSYAGKLGVVAPPMAG